MLSLKKYGPDLDITSNDMLTGWMRVNCRQAIRIHVQTLQFLSNYNRRLREYDELKPNIYQITKFHTINFLVQSQQSIQEVILYSSSSFIY